MGFLDDGAGLAETGFNPDSWQAAAHGATGGVIADLQGGKFAHGFLSAGANKAVHSRLPTDMHPALGGMVSAIVGGTVSELSGGKFANGAITAAMAYAFNQWLSRWPTAAQAQGQQALADARRVQQQAQAEAALTVIEVAEPGIGFLPGGDMMLCLVQGCSSVDWGLAAMGLWPGGGKVGSLMIQGAGKSTARLSSFEKAGIETTTHFRNRLSQRAARGITERNALDAYQNGRLYYNPATGSYVRHSSCTGVSVATDAPSGGRAITVFEGTPSPDWNPVPWRGGQ